MARAGNVVPLRRNDLRPTLDDGIREALSRVEGMIASASVAVMPDGEVRLVMANITPDMLDDMKQALQELQTMLPGRNPCADCCMRIRTY